MAREPGRPSKPTEFDGETLKVARKALLGAANELRLPTARYPAGTRREPNRTVTQPRHLDLAVLALELSQTMEWIAGPSGAGARRGDVGRRG